MHVLTPLELTTRNAAALVDLAREPFDDHAARQAARHARLLDAQFRLLTADGPPDYSGFRKPPVLKAMGIAKRSWHELASSVSATIHAAVMLAADDDLANVETHWEAVRARLLGFEPFDADTIVLAVQGEEQGARLAGVVFRGDGLYEASGETIRLDGQEAFVLQTLVELRAATKDQLADKSGVSDAVSVLKRIRRKHPTLKGAIILPGVKNRGGYRTTIRPA